MTVPHSYRILVIGGSAGSMPVLSALMEAWPVPFHIPVVLVIHRLKNVKSELGVLLSDHIQITEPEDKEQLLPGHIYLAPQNYHLLIEADGTISLDYSELINFSRPSIDLSFESAATAFGSAVIGILLSGANKDGAEGLCRIAAAGGTAIVQDPATAAFNTMPQAALDQCADIQSMTPDQMIRYLRNISTANKR
ncbi:chemotaxis protein CheB [Chitinophaga arvensicola]|uniref:protein-glutamate methylesterase n=1 Tax=Chitinophaga arvensicola TaxID=29529 RepID=A0A1I0RJ85_9BACT|nr:chemotaxis protein CheB [Chitinophaga arvensicola]SEW41066.1 two-component system, chemotaxis family, response regulator CheB [Chitinophaga arvensicola]